MTDEEKVAAIIYACDQIRFDTQGGYPSAWKILDGQVIWASVDHDDAPELVISTIAEFIAEREWAIEEDEDEDEETE